MRVEHLWIEEFKNLRDFTVEFDGTYPITTVVGRNGAGKSNLLEALAVIFRDLDGSLSSSFGYKIRFHIRGDTVEVHNAPGERATRLVRVNGKRSSLAKLHEGDDGLRRLPDFVFGYYSGPTNRLKRHFNRHQAAFNRALREGKDLPLRRLFYAQPEHSQFVLLAFFLAADRELAATFLNDTLRIEGFDSAVFALGQPEWKAKGGDERFWNARGAVAGLLGKLLDLSLAPLRVNVPSNSDSQRRTREHLYLYLPNLSSLRSLSEAYGDSPQHLFAAFESILAADLLADLRVRVRARGLDGALTFRELSEGEQQLLVVLGLLRFTKESESLFLLDEPDTHLNPAWSINYTQMLLEHSGNMESGQILMASHDPLVVASLVAEQVILLRRDDTSGHVRAASPVSDPRGMGVAALLTSEIYGLASDLDPVTFSKVERRRWLASAEWEELDEHERVELKALTAELEDLHFTFTTRDPLYAEFERAMTLRSEESRQILRPDEVAERRRTAGEVLEQIFDESGKQEIV